MSRLQTSSAAVEGGGQEDVTGVITRSRSVNVCPGTRREETEEMCFLVAITGEAGGVLEVESLRFRGGNEMKRGDFGCNVATAITGEGVGVTCGFGCFLGLPLFLGVAGGVNAVASGCIATCTSNELYPSSDSNFPVPLALPALLSNGSGNSTCLDLIGVVGKLCVCILSSEPSPRFLFLTQVLPLSDFMCLFKASLRENARSQLGQTNGLRPVCSLSCRFRSCMRLNRWPQSSHWKGRSLFPQIVSNERETIL
jgi:hypothetical protein